MVTRRLGFAAAFAGLPRQPGIVFPKCREPAGVSTSNSKMSNALAGLEFRSFWGVFFRLNPTQNCMNQKTFPLGRERLPVSVGQMAMI
jgi:hypothetical protein